jgi:hypothetical protein
MTGSPWVKKYKKHRTSGPNANDNEIIAIRSDFFKEKVVKRRHRGTGAQGRRGTKAQRHKGTEAQGHRGTEDGRVWELLGGMGRG